MAYVLRVSPETAPPSFEQGILPLTSTPRCSFVLLFIGNQRSYSNKSVAAFVWNGASLDERWHTAEDPNYLADYFVDTELKELVMLLQTQKEGIFSKGASAIVTKKIK